MSIQKLISQLSILEQNKDNFSVLNSDFLYSNPFVYAVKNNNATLTSYVRIDEMGNYIGTDNNDVFNDIDNSTKDNMFYLGKGSDLALLGAGNNNITSQEGNKVINGGIDGDDIRTGSGKDIILGNEGSDDIFGGGNDDVLSGGDDDDIIDGGDGDDYISGDKGFDILRGRSGNDTFVIKKDDTGVDEIDGGSGRDVVVMLDQNSIDYNLTFVTAGDRPFVLLQDKDKKYNIFYAKNLEEIQFSDKTIYLTNDGKNIIDIPRDNTSISENEGSTILYKFNVTYSTDNQNNITIRTKIEDAPVNGSNSLQYLAALKDADLEIKQTSLSKTTSGYNTTEEIELEITSRSFDFLSENTMQSKNLVIEVVDALDSSNDATQQVRVDIMGEKDALTVDSEPNEPLLIDLNLNNNDSFFYGYNVTDIDDEYELRINDDLITKDLLPDYVNDVKLAFNNDKTQLLTTVTLNKTTDELVHLAKDETLSKNFEFKLYNKTTGDVKTISTDLVFKGKNDPVNILGNDKVINLNETDTAPLSRDVIFNFDDKDLKDSHIVKVAFKESRLITDSTNSVNAKLGSIIVVDAPSRNLNNSLGMFKVNYSINKDDIKFLNDNEKIVETYEVTIEDKEGTLSTKLVTATINGDGIKDFDLVDDNITLLDSLAGTNNIELDLFSNDTYVLNNIDVNNRQISFYNQNGEITSEYGQLSIREANGELKAFFNMPEYFQYLSDGQTGTIKGFYSLYNIMNENQDKVQGMAKFELKIIGSGRFDSGSEIKNVNTKFANGDELRLTFSTEKMTNDEVSDVAIQLNLVDGKHNIVVALDYSGSSRNYITEVSNLTKDDVQKIAVKKLIEHYESKGLQASDLNVTIIGFAGDIIGKESIVNNSSYADISNSILSAYDTLDEISARTDQSKWTNILKALDQINVNLELAKSTTQAVSHDVYIFSDGEAQVDARTIQSNNDIGSKVEEIYNEINNTNNHVKFFGIGLGTDANKDTMDALSYRQVKDNDNNNQILKNSDVIFGSNDSDLVDLLNKVDLYDSMYKMVIKSAKIVVTYDNQDNAEFTLNIEDVVLDNDGYFFKQMEDAIQNLQKYNLQTSDVKLTMVVEQQDANNQVVETKTLDASIRINGALPDFIDDVETV